MHAFSKNRGIVLVRVLFIFEQSIHFFEYRNNYGGHFSGEVKAMMRRGKVTYFVILTLILGIFGLAGLGSAQGAADADLGTSQAGTTQDYPAWVRQAVSGTAYTAADFVHLPFARQLAIIKAVHPEMDTAHLSQAASATAVLGNQQVQTVTTPATPALAAVPQADPVAFGQTYLDIAPSDMGKAFAYFNSGSLTQTFPDGVAFDGAAPGGLMTPAMISARFGSITSPAKTIDPGSFTAAELANLKTTDFVVVNAATDLPATAYKITYSNGGRTTPPNLMVTVNNPATLPYAGKKIVLQVNKNNKALQITFNLWRPDISRVHAELPLGNNLTLQYMFGAYWADATPSHAIFDTSRMNGNPIDVPNFNILQTDPKNPTAAPTRVYSLYEPISAPAQVTDFAGLSTSQGLAVGFSKGPVLPWSVNSATGPGMESIPTDRFYPLAQFDDIKHIHMYRDSTNQAVIHLDYDGYITNPFYLQTLGVTKGIVLRVHSQLQPSPDGRQMSMGERVTNISGQDLTGLYFGRQFDTRMGPVGNQLDNVPLFYAARATDGPREGHPQGIYFRSPSLTSPYTMQFNFNNIAGPDSWSGTHWLSTYQPIVTHQVTSTGAYDLNATINDLVTANGFNMYEAVYARDKDYLPQGYPVFNGPEGKGNAGNMTAQPNDVIFGTGQGGTTTAGPPPDDTAIIMKWSPSQVGSFKDGDSFDMSFNSSINMGTAPVVRADDTYLHVPPTATTVAIPGGVFDLNSNRAAVYYQIDGTPVTTANAGDIANKKTLYTAQYTPAPPHSDYLKFAGQITAAADLQTLTDGKVHTVYLYAIDTPDSTSTVPDPYKQDIALTSNVVQVAVNQPAQVHINLVDENGAALADPVVKQGVMPEPYNFNDFSIGSQSFLTTAATDLQGHAPLALTKGTTKYDLDRTKLPSNGQGRLNPVSGVLNLTYYYKVHPATGGYLGLTVPTVDFGQQLIMAAPGDYPIAKLTSSLVVTNQNPTNKTFQLAAQATKPLTNAAGQELTGALGYELSDGTIVELSSDTVVYTNTNATTSQTSFNVSDGWWKANSPQTGENQISGPRLRITDANRPAIKAGKYTGEITWTVTNGL